MADKSFHEELKKLADDYAHSTYKIASKFPREELYGLTSQLRRSSLSVALNCIEGFARKREKTYKYFLEIAYGSLKESMYLLDFAEKEGMTTKKEIEDILKNGDRIGGMLWGTIQKL